MDKVVRSAQDAVAKIPDGATVMVGGFGVCGNPENLLAALHAQGTRGLTIVSNNAGIDDFGLGRSAQGPPDPQDDRRPTWARTASSSGSTWQASSRSSWCRRARSRNAFARVARASAGFFTPTGYGTLVAEGKETRVIDGRPYVLELPLKADFALVRAWKGDRHGNLVYRKTARNFNPMMATAAAVTLAEVEHLVEPGEIEPDAVHTPGIFVRHILQGEHYERRVEKRTVRASHG